MTVVISGTNGIQNVLGSAAAPSNTNGSSTNTGVYFPTSTTLGIATAGTNAVYVDASQNVGIGTSSPVYQTQIYGSGQTTAALTDAGNKGGSLLLNTPTVAAGDGGALLIGAGGSGAKPYAAIKGLLADGAGNTTGNLAFSTRNATADTALTERMRIDSSGNVGIGTSSLGNGRLTVSGGRIAVIGSAASNAAELYISNTDASGGAWRVGDAIGVSAGTFVIYGGSAASVKLAIDSSGNLMVGTTTASSSLTNGFNAVQTGTATYISVGHLTGSVSGSWYASFAYNGTQIGTISQSGTTAVLYNVTSDQRLKENIQDSESSSSLIDALQVRQFDWKTDNTHQRYGFIAQELVTVAPEAVHQPVNEEEMMAVDYSKLVPMLIKEIQSLRKRLADAGIA